MKVEKKLILITDRFSSEAFYFLDRNPLFKVIRLNSPHHIPSDLMSEAHGLIIRSKTNITEDLLKQMSKLQVVVTATSGFDHIDLEATQKWGISVMHTPDANKESAAQLTWALVLACTNQIVQGFKQVKSGEWNKESLTGTELSGRTYGIVGLGRIGQRVAQIAQAFNMQVVAYDPYIDEDLFLKNNIQRLSYEEVLKVSDVLSFHVPKTLETINMLNKSHFEYIRRGLILINTSRGQVINEDDLAFAIENQWIVSCGLDVFNKEPLSRNSKLLQFSQVVLTPHIGAHTEDAFHKASHLAALKISQFFADASTSDSLPPRVPWYGATPFKSE